MGKGAASAMADPPPGGTPCTPSSPYETHRRDHSWDGATHHPPHSFGSNQRCIALPRGWLQELEAATLPLLHPRDPRLSSAGLVLLLGAAAEISCDAGGSGGGSGWEEGDRGAGGGRYRWRPSATWMQQWEARAGMHCRGLAGDEGVTGPGPGPGPGPGSGAGPAPGHQRGAPSACAGGWMDEAMAAQVRRCGQWRLGWPSRLQLGSRHS
jgi:hypothetical protein